MVQCITAFLYQIDLTIPFQPWFYAIFKDWENAGVKNYKPMILKYIPDFSLESPPHDIKSYLEGYRSELKKV